MFTLSRVFLEDGENLFQNFWSPFSISFLCFSVRNYFLKKLPPYQAVFAWDTDPVGPLRGEASSRRQPQPARAPSQTLSRRRHPPPPPSRLAVAATAAAPPPISTEPPPLTVVRSFFRNPSPFFFLQIGFCFGFFGSVKLRTLVRTFVLTITVHPLVTDSKCSFVSLFVSFSFSRVFP